jgi:hypothetical protein
MTTYEVRPIDKSKTKPFILEIHYAKRTPPISYAYGLFRDDQLVGICTYGKPPSSTLIKGVCGEKWAPNVFELNRLCLLDNLPNEASRLVAGSFKLLPKPLVVVSYADTKQNHTGIVYQATNFLYTGLSAKFRDPVVKGLEHQHHATYAHGLSNLQLKEKYGEENVYFIDRSRKHRYIKFLGSRTEIKEMIKDLRYKTEAYPKEERN